VLGNLIKRITNPKVLFGTFLQLAIFAALAPYIAILLGIIMKSSPGIITRFLDGIMEQISLIDIYDSVSAGLKDIDTTQDVTYAALTYANRAFEIVSSNFEISMYLAIWLHIFRLLFSDLPAKFNKLRGLPILQIVCGLFMGVLSMPQLYDAIDRGDLMMTVLTLAVPILLLTLLSMFLFPEKSLRNVIWYFFKKTTEFAADAILVIFTVGYVAVVRGCFKGAFPDVMSAVTACIIIIGLWLLYMILYHLLRD